MTKKYGDHTHDARIANVTDTSGKWMIQRKADNLELFFGALADARSWIGRGSFADYFTKNEMTRFAPKVHPNQPRPAAKPAVKAHVPKSSLAKPKAVAKPKKAAPSADPWPRGPIPASAVWPFPGAPTTPQTIVNGVRIELDPGLKIDYIGPLHIKVKKG